MKKLGMLVVMIVSLSTLSKAQNGRPESQDQKPPSVEQRIEKATGELKLTDAQVKEWKEIHAKYDKGERLSREQHEALGKELEATLNDEQLKKFKELRKNHRPPHQGGK